MKERLKKLLGEYALTTKELSYSKNGTMIRYFTVVFDDYENQNHINLQNNNDYWIPKIKKEFEPRDVKSYFYNSNYVGIWIEDSIKINRKLKIDRLNELYKKELENIS